MLHAGEIGAVAGEGADDRVFLGREQGGDVAGSVGDDAELPAGPAGQQRLGQC